MIITSNKFIYFNLEYGATIGFFPVDHSSIDYLRQTNRNSETIEKIENYLIAAGMMRNYNDKDQDPVFTEVI